MVLTASFVISPAIGFFVTVIPEKLASHELDASVEASGPHDFSVRIRCSRLWHRQRPPHPAPRFVTIASRPSCRVGTGRACKDDLPDETSALFLAPGLDSFCRFARRAVAAREGPTKNLRHAANGSSLLQGRMFAEKLCQPSAIGNIIRSVRQTVPREAIWLVPDTRFGTSGTRNGTCRNCNASEPLGLKRRFGRWFSRKNAQVSRSQAWNTARTAPCVLGLDRF